MTYDQYLVTNLLLMNAILAVVAGAAAWWLAGRLRKGWIMGAVGVPIVLVGGVILSAVNVLVWLTGWGGARAFEPLTQKPLSGLAFYWESGIEFGLLGIGVALIVYVVGRWRMRRG